MVGAVRGEEALAVAEDDRELHEVDLVDEVPLEQSARQPRTPHEEQLAVVRVLERADARGDVARDEMLAGVDPALIGRSFVVALDDGGVHVFRGKEDAQLVTSVAWVDVLGVSETVVTIQRKSYAGLSLRVRTRVEPVDLAFAVSGRGLNPARGRTVEELRDRILSFRSAAVGGRPGSAPSAPTTSYVTPARRAMIPGVASTTWSRVLRVTSSLTSVPLIALIGVQIVRLTEGDALVAGLPLVPVVAVFIAIVLVNFGVILLAARRQRAESVAGYTLLRTGDMNLDQVDPATGYLIRPAGSEQLTRDGERSALARIRALT